MCLCECVLQYPEMKLKSSMMETVLHDSDDDGKVEIVNDIGKQVVEDESMRGTLVDDVQ